MPDPAPSPETLLLRQQLEQMRDIGNNVERKRIRWESLKAQTKEAKDELDLELEVLASRARQDSQTVADFGEGEK